MNRLEAIKAMLEGKKVGNLNSNDYSYFFIEDRDNPIKYYDGVKVINALMIHSQDYYVIKNKVKKYLIAYTEKDCKYVRVTKSYYTSIIDFENKLYNLKGLQILESTMIEVEEE